MSISTANRRDLTSRLTKANAEEVAKVMAAALRASEFSLFITRAAEFEIPSIPENKAALKSFIERSINESGIKTHSYFGFYDEGHAAEDQRNGGFNVGFFISEAELAFINRQRSRFGNEKKPTTRLFKNEADISLAARSFHSVVLTLDKKNGPLKDAYDQGGKVVFLTDFDAGGMSLSEFIKSAFKAKVD